MQCVLIAVTTGLPTSNLHCPLFLHRDVGTHDILFDPQNYRVLGVLKKIEASCTQLDMMCMRHCPQAAYGSVSFAWGAETQTSQKC